jgi:pyruvate dehydrogenase E1 component alpha subunit
MVEKEKMIEIYKTMLKIRTFEEKSIELYFKGINRGALHPYIGEEAVAVGACKALQAGDYITSTHRGHGHCIAMGGDMKLMLAELLGKSTGYCKGKGGSMHIASFDLGILGANGVVGGGIPLAVGAALAIDNRESKNVVLCFFGDGASNQGSFHEAANMAATWKLPIVFICENNLYALSTSVSESLSIKDVAERAVGYGIPGIVVDGNDVLAVYGVVKEAVLRARNGNGPSLVECKTYRFKGHWVADPLLYRTSDECEEWKKRCPIKCFKSKLINEKILTDKEAEEIENIVNREMLEAEKFAKESPYPNPNEAFQDVWAQ